MARSSLFVTVQPGGVFHVDNTALTVGNVWYVDSGAAGKGTTSAYGYNPDAPFSTLVAASDSGNLASGDVVLVAAGHTETISAAAGWDCDTAGVTFLGLGVGDLRPTITLDTDPLSDIDIDAANVVFDNLRFVANFLDVAAAIDVNADGFTCRNCEFVDTSTILNSKMPSARVTPPRSCGELTSSTTSSVNAPWRLRPIPMPPSISKWPTWHARGSWSDM